MWVAHQPGTCAPINGNGGGNNNNNKAHLAQQPSNRTELSKKKFKSELKKLLDDNEDDLETVVMNATKLVCK